MATADRFPQIAPEMPPPPREDVPTREPDGPNLPHNPELPADQEDVPTDVEPGSDADIDRGGAEAMEPGPSDEQPGNDQMDDNIDEFGRKPDGTALDQPGVEGVGDDD